MGSISDSLILRLQFHITTDEDITAGYMYYLTSGRPVLANILDNYGHFNYVYSVKERWLGTDNFNGQVGCLACAYNI